MGKLAGFLIFLSLVERSSAGEAASPALGEACVISEEDECTRSDNNAECDDTNTCICRANYVEEFAVCKIKVDGSTSCVSTTDCPSNATCAGQCNCNDGYATMGFLCTAVVGIGCSSTTQCTDVLANTVCSSSQCACVSGYTGTTCTDIVIGMSCVNDCDCQDVLLNTVCTSNKCTCAAGFCFSGSACSLSGAGKLPKTTTISIATFLLTVIYKSLRYEGV